MQAVRVKPRHDADGVFAGGGLCGQRLKELAAKPEVGKFQGRVLVEDAVDGVGRLAGLGAEQGTDVGLTLAHGLCGQQGPLAADDAQPDAALVVLGGQDLDLAHRAGGGGVGAAAGADIGTGDAHDAHLAFDLFLAAVGQRGQLLAGGVGDAHRHILPDDAVGGKFGLPQTIGGDGDAGVHPHRVGADVEPDVLGPEHLVQDAGEDVLTGVLLHLVEPPGPVKGLLHCGAGGGGFGQIIYGVPDDAALLVDVGDVQHRAVRKGQGAPVGRLTAAFGVKDRAVQRDLSAAVAVRLGREDAPCRLGAVGIGLVIFLSGLHGVLLKNLSVIADAMPPPLIGELSGASPTERFIP